MYCWGLLIPPLPPSSSPSSFSSTFFHTGWSESIPGTRTFTRVSFALGCWILPLLNWLNERCMVGWIPPCWLNATTTAYYTKTNRDWYCEYCAHSLSNHAGNKNGKYRRWLNHAKSNAGLYRAANNGKREKNVYTIKSNGRIRTLDCEFPPAIVRELTAFSLSIQTLNCGMQMAALVETTNRPPVLNHLKFYYKNHYTHKRPLITREKTTGKCRLWSNHAKMNGKSQSSAIECIRYLQLNCGMPPLLIIPKPTAIEIAEYYIYTKLHTKLRKYRRWLNHAKSNAGLYRAANNGKREKNVYTIKSNGRIRTLDCEFPPAIVRELTAFSLSIQTLNCGMQMAALVETTNRPPVLNHLKFYYKNHYTHKRPLITREKTTGKCRLWSNHAKMNGKSQSSAIECIRYLQLNCGMPPLLIIPKPTAIEIVKKMRALALESCGIKQPGKYRRWLIKPC